METFCDCSTYMIAWEGIDISEGYKEVLKSAGLQLRIKHVLMNCIGCKPTFVSLALH